MNEVMQVLEGWCAKHESYTTLIRAGGTVDFLEDHGYSGELAHMREEAGLIEIRRWSAGAGETVVVGEIGELTFQCEHGHTLSAFALAGGDWAI